MEHGKVLVIDDEKIVQRVVTKMLRKMGFEVEAVSNGKRAVELYRRAMQTQKPFTAVIIDLKLSGKLGGKQTFDALRRIDPNICAIVSSGNLQDPILNNYGAYGFRAAVKKPFKFSEFKETILAQR